MRWQTLILLCLLPVLSAMADEAAWDLWREGKAVLIMRHALAPGTGDPANFQLADCSTQRNLNERGRQQSHAWGTLLQQQYAGEIALYSSQWCRCLETARLMNIAAVQPLPALNSFFAGRGSRKQQTEALLQQFAADQPMPTVLVSHQVNFTALTGYFPASGEAAILALPLTAPATVLARIEP
ncbi:Histidine phosphatase superfamily (branch 1) [Arsukibacterium tuosuense]|uniref:Histidine phosphatase superfamily (Branch 1) n=1 Tax=Arsukibacterium tuosuense TaxID=1323745 RepID=A0A285IRT4_9GAMM|nr:histidine phosphatase family protein [Arsukibacterium tuosuense]SNY49671.1 Histidine phosphatase superfamily (branch 1) [Arsukibacterium tuosuense]